jgi:hypothetical protein
VWGSKTIVRPFVTTYAIKVHLISRNAKLHTQTIFFISPNDMDLIAKNFIYNNEHTCTCMMCPSKGEK